MKAKTKGAIFTGCGYAISAAAPLVATATQFPVFIEKSANATISGIFVLMCCIVAIPMLLYVKRLKTANRAIAKPPTAICFWALLLGGSVALEAIIQQFKFIGAAGLAGTCVAEVFFYAAKRVQTKALAPSQKAVTEAVSLEEVSDVETN